MSKPTTGSRHAFTLIELLVVMAVICILAGMLIPVLGAARRAAKRAGTRNTIAQVAQAIKNYTADWGPFPPDLGPGARVAPESLFYYLCTPSLSPQHPYLEPHAGVQTCDFTFTGTGRQVQPNESTTPPATNNLQEIADGWQHPIYYDMSDTSANHHNTNSFDLWSGGADLKNNNGADGSDDIKNW
jgi:prepilin-type N-terminal cleavage/methylation domain-containing protein